MGLLEASQAVIDCGQNELVLEDICRDSTAPDAWNLIFTGDHAPINQRAYRVSPTERRIIHEEVQKMLDEGIVQPSESPWSSPVVLEAGLKLNSKKCLFAAQEVKILGHLVSSNGVRPDPDKIKAVRNFPTPKNIHDIRSFLWPLFILLEDLLKVSLSRRTLQSLLKSGVEFHWGPEEVEAFNSLKKALTSIQYWGCTTKELLQKSILMQAGTVSELS
ncbi:transposon Ty3-I Gag-Pol polyprotein [Trichonephila clavipes]|nr:transposon Ty3-I Gag-Pol polyprotein [Trichonephila clavipes]